MYEVAEIIRKQIGIVNLMCFAARRFVGANSDDKTHDGFLEFTASNNPKIKQKVQVRIELAFNDSYTIKVFDKEKEFAHIQDIYCDQLTEILFEILG